MGCLLYKVCLSSLDCSFLIFRLSLTPSLPRLLYGYTGWPGRDGTEQEGAGLTQVAEATGSTRAAAATREGPLHTLLFFVIVSLLSSFLYLTLLLFRLFLFRQLHQQAGHGRKEPDGRDGIHVGGDSNVGRHGGTEGADGANGYVILYFLVLSDLLFYSYHSSSFPIIDFSVEYNNRRAGRDR